MRTLSPVRIVVLVPSLLALACAALAAGAHHHTARAEGLARDPPRAQSDALRGVICGARKRPHALASAQSPAPTEPLALDALAPSQRLASDRARPGVRIVFGLVLRAPFDRSYGLSLDYGASRFFEIGTVVAMREDRGLELGGSLAFRPLGRGFAGLLVRATASAIVASGRSTAPTAGRLDAGIGYAMFGAGVYFEVLGGAAYRLGAPYEHDRWAVSLAVRLGLGF